MFDIEAVDFHGTTQNVRVDLLNPDHCPSCHVKVDPKLLGSYLSGIGLESRYLDRVYRCPKRGCGSIFVAMYRGYFETGGYTRTASWYDYKFSGPGKPTPPELPESVCQVSPNFENFYSQAMAAEHYGLDEVCGVGLRKALEFLVKDYLTSISETLGVDADAIKKESLGNCIRDHIDDQRIKKLAKLASWLGNDETHYERRWQDKDLSDLKALIHLTINALDNAIVGDEYIKAMAPEQDPK